jgi:hypothetical protein
MPCPDTWTCIGNGCSLVGTAIAAWQGFRASNLLRRAERIGTESEPEGGGAVLVEQHGPKDIPIEEAFNAISNKLASLATGWQTKNHVWLIIGIVIALLGQGISMYRSAWPLHG